MKKTVAFMSVLAVIAFFGWGCDMDDSTSDSDSSVSTSVTGASCVSTGSVTVSETIVVTSGVYDGGCQTFNATSDLGDGSQDETQSPVFRIENGATLKNVIIGSNGADGIHLYNSATLDNITWTDVGEDALTVKSEGTYSISNIEGYDAADKFFQINAACTFNVSNAIIHRAGKALRQNGGTTFEINVTFDRCELQDLDEGVFRTDSSSSTASITNSCLDNAGDICIGNWASCNYSNITDGPCAVEDDSSTTDEDDSSTTDEDDSSTTDEDDSSTTGSYDLIVASDGSGDYKSVQDAINAAPSYGGTWYTIFIKNGTYREVITVPSDKTYLQLIGESAEGTVISYDNYADLVGSTSGSATAFFQADNFIARDITFENAFDYPNSSASNKQAVAAEPMADRQVFVNCKFTGYQDTLYVRNGRIYFRGCYIAGHTDFIFGDATAVFDQCAIYSLPKNGGCISAPSTLASTAYGLIFMNCNVTGTSTGIWLGRPWHPSSAGQSIKSNAVYLNCDLGSHIAVDGWTSMSGVYPSTERMYEYNNSGSGAQVNSSRPQLSAGEAAAYTVGNILSGSDGWDPAAWADMETISGDDSTAGEDDSSTTDGTISGAYSIIAVHSGKALGTTRGWGTTDGTNIAQYFYWGGKAQQFNITPVDGIWHRIAPVIASDQAMAVSGCVTDAGANIQTSAYTGDECQQFRFQSADTGKWRIIARNSGLCVDVLNASTGYGANVIQDDCISGSENQMFELKQQ